MVDFKGTEWKGDDSRTNLNAASQSERLLTWKEQFKHLLGKTPEIINKPIKKLRANEVLNEIILQCNNLTLH